MFAKERTPINAPSTVTGETGEKLVPVSLSLPVKLHDDLVALLEGRGMSLSKWAAIMARGYMRMPSEHTLTTALSFKKHAGEALEDIIRLDPGYIRWLMKNIEGFRMDEKSLKLLNQIDPGGN